MVLGFNIFKNYFGHQGNRDMIKKERGSRGEYVDNLWIKYIVAATADTLMQGKGMLSSVGHISEETCTQYIPYVNCTINNIKGSLSLFDPAVS